MVVKPLLDDYFTNSIFVRLQRSSLQLQLWSRLSVYRIPEKRRLWLTLTHLGKWTNVQFFSPNSSIFLVAAVDYFMHSRQHSKGLRNFSHWLRSSTLYHTRKKDISVHHLIRCNIVLYVYVAKYDVIITWKVLQTWTYLLPSKQSDLLMLMWPATIVHHLCPHPKHSMPHIWKRKEIPSDTVWFDLTVHPQVVVVICEVGIPCKALQMKHNCTAKCGEYYD